MQLLTAWLLLLLEHEVTHGYELCRELNARDLNVELSVVYRTLRKFERDGWTASQWKEPAGGPRKRCYHLTPEGRRNLDHATALVASNRKRHDAFLRAASHPRPADTVPSSRAAVSAPSSYLPQINAGG